MQRAGRDSFYSGSAAETPWTYKEPHRDAEAENDHAAIYKVVAACGLTAALNIVAVQFNSSARDRPCSSSTAYDLFSYFPSSMIPISRCETSLLLLAVMTCLHWSCIFGLFNRQPRRKTQSLPHIIMATLYTLLPAATIARDTTTVFVQLLPIITDIYVVAALLINHSLQETPAVEIAR
jgi:predicted membrane channel-forming protein YqfA (hemolysin III family)